MELKVIIREFSGAAMSISFMLCSIPQIIKIYKTKSSANVSASMILLGMSGYSFGLVYMFSTKFGIWWLLNYGSGIITSSCLLYLWHKYNKK